MNSFNVDRTQHAIGQGGFHSTMVYRGGRRFGLVVDCGGATGEHREDLAAAFAETGPRAHDLLAISELDEDHVNGLPALAKAGVTFANVMLPHVDRTRYLLWMTMRLALSRGDTLSEEELIAKALDVMAGLYAGRYGRPLIVTDDAEAIADDDARCEPGDDFLRPALRRALDAAREGATFPARSSLHLAGIDWMLRFHSREWQLPKMVEAIWDLPVLADLRRAVGELGDRAATAGNAALLDAVTAQLRAELDLKSVQVAATRIVGRRVTLPATMTAKVLLATLFRKMPELHDANNASLCVYAGPGNRGNAAPRSRFVRHRTIGAAAEIGNADAPQRSVGWLLAGDAPLADEKSLAALVRHYFLELPLVETLVLPHHGARRNYGKSLAELQALAEALPAGARRLFIAAAEPSGPQRLPDASVIELCRRFGDLHVVDRRAASMVQDGVRSVAFPSA